MPENPTGMMSSSKNQKGFKKNAKTGGADIIEFDEDKMTSDTSDSSENEDDSLLTQSALEKKGLKAAGIVMVLEALNFQSVI